MVVSVEFRDSNYHTDLNAACFRQIEKVASGSEETIYLTLIVRKDGQNEHGPVASHSTQHLVCTETIGIVCTKIVSA